MRNKRRGISTGTIFMLTLTALVLIGFAALLPRLTGSTSISTNAIELAVKIDESFSQLLSAQSSKPVNKPSNTAFAPLTTAVPTSTPSPTTQPVKRFSLCASGVIQLDNGSLSSMTDKETGYHFEWLLGQLGNSLQADLTITTLKNLVIPTDKLSATNMPVELLAAMKTAGIDAVSVGHHAALNAGVNGLAATKTSIRNAGILPYGLYASQEERNAPVLYNANGVSVALLSYQNEISSTGSKKTSKEEQAFAYAPIEISIIQQDIAKARSCGAEVVIVSLCWGRTSATAATNDQRAQAQQIADAGADVILGTNPQAVFPVEILTAQRGDGKYHPVLCAYSMGNLFTFDRESRVNLAGLLLHADVQYDPATGTVAFDNLVYDPTYCWRGKVDGVTRTGVLSAVADNAPAFVDENQLGVMGRCYNLISEVMKDGVLKER